MHSAANTIHTVPSKIQKGAKSRRGNNRNTIIFKQTTWNEMKVIQGHHNDAIWQTL